MKKAFLFFVVTGVLLAAAAESRAATLDDLEKQVETLKTQVKELRYENADSSVKTGSGSFRKILGSTRIGGYGEFDYIFKSENGNGKGGNTFDPHRVVLYVNSDLSDWVKFYSEFEWEHGGDGKNGKVPLEQAFLDFKIAPAFNIKAGVLLVPVGGVNIYHEPNNFNSTERPDLDRILIPSTWREMGAGIHGSLGAKADYELLVVNGLDGSKFSAESGIRGGRQDLDADINRNKAVAGRLEIRPITNLYTNVSFYTGNSAKKGTAYTTVAAIDGTYRLADLELSGEYVHVYQDDPKSLGTDTTKGLIGNNMSGYWVEGAYHVMPERLKTGKLAEADALVFARYSEIDTQKGVADEGYNRSYSTVGISFKPIPTVAVKADYQWYDDNRPDNKSLDNDKFQVTVGFVF